MLEAIIKERLRKRDNLIKAGQNPYPSRIEIKYKISDVLRRFLFLRLFRYQVLIGGRIVGLRIQGGIMFLDLRDATGKIQVVLNKKNLADFDLLRENLDLGDFAAVRGRLFNTKKGEKSVLVREFRVVVKSLRPMPSEWYGLKDVEERYRRRYLDLLFNRESRDIVLQRYRIIQKLRELLENSGFLEVETPTLQPLPGGAMARPFRTHYNALDADFYLRIAPELYLKRLLVGGLEKIFEIGKVFRNEGIDRDHNPEFTELELYWAYQDYQELMKFIQRVFQELWREFRGGEWRWEKITFSELFKKHIGKNWDELPPEEVEKLYKEKIRLAGKIKITTLVVDYPEIMMPLAKLKAEDRRLTESFQLVAGSEDTGALNGPELIKGFSELNDPAYQREQMELQEKALRAGNEEASRLDEDFLEALEYGMPPAAGLGIGIDRLVMILTKADSIRETIAFPTLRPKG